MAAEFKITGLEPALRKMRAVTVEVTLKGVRGSASKAMTIVRDAARAKAKRFDDPDTASNISENIVISTRAYPRLGEVRSRVGVKGGANLNKQLATYGKNKKNIAAGRVGQTYNVAHWRFLEFGTSEMRAQPFMRPALQENIDKVVSVFVDDLDKNIDRIVAKTK